MFCPMGKKYFQVVIKRKKVKMFGDTLVTLGENILLGCSFSFSLTPKVWKKMKVIHLIVNLLTSPIKI